MRTASQDRTASVSILAAATAVGIVATMAWAAPQQTPEHGFTWKDGAEVYTKVCALCHETKTGPTIRGLGLDPLYITLIVRNGSGAMPAFREAEIDDQTLEKLAAYVSKQAADK